MAKFKLTYTEVREYPYSVLKTTQHIKSCPRLALAWKVFRILRNKEVCNITIEKEKLED